MKNNSISTKENYKFVIYGLCFLIIFFALGFCSSCRGIFLSPITEALNIKRSVFTVSDTFRFATTAILNSFFGILVSRFGTKKLILAGSLCIIASCLINAFTSVVIGFYLAGICLGIGLAWTSTAMIGSIIRKWSPNNSGKVMGIVLSANGLGSAIASQILTPIIYEDGNKFGYRNAYLLCAIIIAVIFVLCLIFFKDKESNTDNNCSKKKSNSYFEGIDVKTALKTPFLYLTGVYLFFIGIIIQGFLGTFAAHIKDSGISAAQLATVVSIQSVALVLSKILSGFLTDKFGIKSSANICNIAGIGAGVLFLSINNSNNLMLLSIIGVIIFSIAVPLETIMVPLIVGEIFGQKSYNTFLGISTSIICVGMALGNPVTNLTYDIFGNYKIAYTIFIFVLIFCTVVFNLAVNASNKFKKSL